MNPLKSKIVTALSPLAFAAAFTSANATHAALVAQYHFDESAGSTTVDSAGAFDGTLSPTGAAFVAGGIAGNAISLDRPTNGLVNMGTAFPGFTSGDFSIVAWIKTTDTSNDTLVLSKHNGGSENGYFLNPNITGGGGATGKATFYASEFVSQSPTSSTTVTDGQWHQIVGVYHAGGLHMVYVDGSPAEASTASHVMVANTSAFTVGGLGQQNGDGTPNARYTGLIDEVQVYDQALTDGQIDFLFQNPAQAIPEPVSLSLLGLGVVGWVGTRRRARKA